MYVFVCVHFDLCRKVKDESATGSSTTSRVRTVLTVSVEGIEFDTAACMLRVKGRNIQENQYVKVSVCWCTAARLHVLGSRPVATVYLLMCV